MLGMKNHFDISGSIEIREVDIAGVACSCFFGQYLDSFPANVFLGKILSNHLE